MTSVKAKNRETYLLEAQFIIGGTERVGGYKFSLQGHAGWVQEVLILPQFIVPVEKLMTLWTLHVDISRL